MIKDGYKLKGLVLATTKGEFYVKLAKHLRAAFDLRIPQGTLLQVIGKKEYNLKTGEVKLTSQRVMADRQEWNRQNSSDLPLSMSDHPGIPVSSSNTTARPSVALQKFTTCLMCQVFSLG